MARLAREIALQHGDKLPAFPNRQDAEQHWFTFRDKHLALLLQMAHEHPELDLDYTPASLKQLEQWYFHLYENDAFESIGTTRETFETCMAMYFGETVVRNTSARWIVGEYFLAPGKYELGVCREQTSMMVNRFTDHFRTPNNKRKQSLFRRYKQYFSRFTSTPLDLDMQLKKLLRQNKRISAMALYQEHKRCSPEEARQYIESL
jgi:hypothetical protein